MLLMTGFPLIYFCIIEETIIWRVTNRGAGNLSHCSDDNVWIGPLDGADLLVVTETELCVSNNNNLYAMFYHFLSLSFSFFLQLCVPKNGDVYTCVKVLWCLFCICGCVSNFIYLFFRKTIKTLICPEIIPDVNVERWPLEPSNEACSISPAPNLTS